MADLNYLVLQGFKVNAVLRNIKERAAYICETKDGIKLIRSAWAHAGPINFAHTVQEHVARVGYPWTDRFNLSQDGLPYVAADGDHFIMTDYIEERDSDFRDPNAFLHTVAAVANWHRCAREVPVPPPEAHIIQTSARFRKQSAELKTLKKRICRQARLSDFDVLFIKNVDIYAQRIDEAAALLDSANYAQRQTAAFLERRICHNAFKEESLRINDNTDGVYVTRCTEATIDCQLNDLCSLIRRHARYQNQSDASGNRETAIVSTKQTLAPLSTVLDAYTDIVPLDGDDIKILYALLIYPQPFLKAVTEYYMKRRTWAPSAVFNKMEHVISVRDSYENYVGNLIT